MYHHMFGSLVIAIHRRFSAIIMSEDATTSVRTMSNPTTTVAVNSPKASGKTETPVVEEPESPTAIDIIDLERGRLSPTGVAGSHEMQNDMFIKKLELKVSGFIDLSGLIATFAVLVLLLSQPNRNEYFLPVMSFVFISMILQCVLALTLVIRHNTLDTEAQVVSSVEGGSTEERNWYIRESRRLLTFSSISLIFITLFNILIAAFAGLAGAAKTLPPDCPNV